MHGFSMMTSRQSASPIGGEGNSQTTHGSIVVECITRGCSTSIISRNVLCQDSLYMSVISIIFNLVIHPHRFWLGNYQDEYTIYMGIIATIQIPIYSQNSNITCTKFQNLNVSRFIFHLALPNPSKPGVKSRMKMQFEQRPEAMLQLRPTNQ